MAWNYRLAWDGVYPHWLVWVVLAIASAAAGLPIARWPFPNLVVIGGVLGRRIVIEATPRKALDINDGILSVPV